MDERNSIGLKRVRFSRENVPAFYIPYKDMGLGPPQTREIVIDNYLVVDYKKLSITKIQCVKLVYIDN